MKTLLFIALLLALIGLLVSIVIFFNMVTNKVHKFFREDELKVYK